MEIFIKMTPKSYIERVDEAYLDCKQKRLSRFSDEWDAFSKEINRKRLQAIKNTNGRKIESLFNQCLSYWFNRSELLELHLKNKLLNNSKRKKFAKEGKKIRENILNGVVDAALGTSGIIDIFAKYHRTNSQRSVN